MNASGNNITVRNFRTSNQLVWFLSFVLLFLPYTELLQASPQPAEMPCHQQVMTEHHSLADDCLHELGDADCHCCDLQAPVSIVTDCDASPCLIFLVSSESIVSPPGFPAIPQTPLYRPPIQTAL